MQELDHWRTFDSCWPAAAAVAELLSAEPYLVAGFAAVSYLEAEADFVVDQQLEAVEDSAEIVAQLLYQIAEDSFEDSVHSFVVVAVECCLEFAGFVQAVVLAVASDLLVAPWLMEVDQVWAQLAEWQELEVSCSCWDPHFQVFEA